MTFGQRPKQSSNAFACGNNQNCGNVLSDTPTTRVVRPPGGKSSIVLGWDDSSTSSSRSKQPLCGRNPAPLPDQGVDPLRAGFGRRPGTSSNAFASGSNQNCGNVLSDVSTTRVLGPPGGASSLNLGWDSRSLDERSTAGRVRPARDIDGYPSGTSPRNLRSPPPVAGGYYEPAADNAMARAPYPPQQPLSPTGGEPKQFFSSQGSFPSPPVSPTGSRTSWVQEAGASRLPQESSWQSPRDGRSPQQGFSQEAFGTRPKVTGNSFASGANQNCGNVLTGVPSTRVNRPPGGATAISLSWDDTGGPKQDRPPRPATGGGGTRLGAVSAKVGQSAEAAFGQRPRVGGNTFATGSDQNCGNMLTDTPTTRVLRPPGGASNFSLAWD